MPPSPDPAPAPDGALLLRFVRAERLVHRSLAALLAACIGTAALLYIPDLSVLVSRRDVVSAVHVVAGLLLPVPLVLGWALSPAFRADVRRLNRVTAADWDWLRSSDRRSGRIAVGKFNAGQKLNAAFTLGAVLVLLGTGLLMRFSDWAPIGWRTGATFVHDWLALAVVVVVAGHSWMAARDPVARAGMRTGLVPGSWARAEHAGWVPDSPAGPTRVSDGPD